jgi:hypothetical protein
MFGCTIWEIDSQTEEIRLFKRPNPRHQISTKISSKRQLAEV